MLKKFLNNILESIRKMRLYARVGLTSMTPLKAYVMLRYWILTNIFKKEIPWVIELSVTYRCQCRCEHCSVSNYISEAGEKKELTKDQIEDVLQQAVKMGIPKVDYFGGEPLLRKDIVDLVKIGARKGLYMSITTNGWLLTQDMAKKLKKAGISCMNISIDSTSKEEHDRLRVLPGLYKRAVDAIRYCHKERISCVVSTYVTRDRIVNFGVGELDNSDLTKILSLSRELKASGVRVLFPIISGEWVSEDKKEFTQEEVRRVIDGIDSSFAFIEGAYSVKNGRKICQSLQGKMFNISPYGEVQLCIAFTDVFGNVKDASLKDLLKGMYTHPTYIRNKDSYCCSTTGLKRC